ncbi:MAG: hypothetical protein AAF849_09940 [Bacteroidota bacterium]
MEAIRLEQRNKSYLITIAEDAIDKDMLSNLLDRLRLEHLLKKADFDESIEQLDEAIKIDWWKRNEARIMRKIDLV